MIKSKKRRAFNDRVAVVLTKIAGSMPFFWVIVALYAVWMVWNGFAPEKYRFDGEWFPLLLFISNMIQILYMPILQVGQNIIQKNAETRSESYSQMLIKTETLIRKLDAMEKDQREVTSAILCELEHLKGKLENK